MDFDSKDEVDEELTSEAPDAAPSEEPRGFKAKFKALFVQFIKFGIVGLTNTAISYGIYAGMLFIGCHYIVANITQFVLSVAWSYYWNNRMVFTLDEGQHRVWWKSLLKTYAAYAFTGLFLNSILLVLWVDVLGISAYIAFFLNLIVSIPTNFLINRFWAFRIES